MRKTITVGRVKGSMIYTGVNPESVQNPLNNDLYFHTQEYKFYCYNNGSWNEASDLKEHVAHAIIEELEEKKVLENIDELQQERHNLHQEPIKDLLHKGDIVLNHHNKQDELIDIMLRNGYIQEDYLDYISIFHEGSLTRQDHHFIIEYRKGKKLDANYPLPNAVAVINKLETFCFSHDILLNYNIVDAIFNKEVKNGEQKQNNLFCKLSDESNSSVLFIDSYID